MTIAAAMMFSTVVTFSMMVMMIAADIGIVAKITCQQIDDRCIRITAATAVEGDAGFCQRHLGAAADTAADQHICLYAA